MAFRRHGSRHYGAGSAWERHNDRGGQVATEDGLVATETTSLLAAAKLTWPPKTTGLSPRHKSLYAEPVEACLSGQPPAGFDKLSLKEFETWRRANTMTTPAA